MSDSSIIHPDYIHVVERKPEGWGFKLGKMFYNPLPFAVDLQDFELLYGISEQKVVIELFRVNGGKTGYYIADLKHKKYYYCGLDWGDIRTTLLKLGIGRADPMEK